MTFLLFKLLGLFYFLRLETMNMITDYTFTLHAMAYTM